MTTAQDGRFDDVAAHGQTVDLDPADHVSLLGARLAGDPAPCQRDACGHTLHDHLQPGGGGSELVNSCHHCPCVVYIPPADIP